MYIYIQPTDFIYIEIFCATTKFVVYIYISKNNGIYIGRKIEGLTRLYIYMYGKILKFQIDHVRPSPNFFQS